MTLEEKTIELDGWLRAAHVPRQDYAIGIGDRKLHVYVKRDMLGGSKSVPNVWKGTPVEWHFNVGIIPFQRDNSGEELIANSKRVHR